MISNPVRERPLPYSEDAEMATIGSILLDPSKIRECFKHKVSPEVFYLPMTKAAYMAMREAVQRNQVPDIVVVEEIMKAHNQKSYDKTWGLYLEKCITKAPDPSRFMHYLDIVIGKYKRREVIAIANQAHADAHESEEHEDTMLSKIRSALHRLTSEHAVIESITQIAARLTEIFLNARKTGKAVGVPSRWFDIQTKITGYKPGKMSIVAARPAMGKTTFSLNEALHKAMIGIAVLIVSLEMTKDELLMKMICDIMSLDSTRFYSGAATLEEITAWNKGAAFINALPIYYECGNRTVEEIASVIREYHVRHEIEFVVIDYIQIIAESNRRFANRNAELSHISGTLMHLATETGIHIQIDSQLSRAFTMFAKGKKQKQEEPELQHLRDCGQLEQDAFLVIFLFPDPEFPEEDFPDNVPTIAKIAKQRMGACGRIAMTFNKVHSRFLGNDNKVLSLPDVSNEEPF